MQLIGGKAFQVITAGLVLGIAPRAMRNSKGIVQGGESFSNVLRGHKWFRGTHGSTAKIPRQVADALRGGQRKPLGKTAICEAL